MAKQGWKILPRHWEALCGALWFPAHVQWKCKTTLLNPVSNFYPYPSFWSRPFALRTELHGVVVKSPPLKWNNSSGPSCAISSVQKRLSKYSWCFCVTVAVCVETLQTCPLDGVTWMHSGVVLYTVSQLKCVWAQWVSVCSRTAPPYSSSVNWSITVCLKCINTLH